MHTPHQPPAIVPARPRQGSRLLATSLVAVLLAALPAPFSDLSAQDTPTGEPPAAPTESPPPPAEEPAPPVEIVKGRLKTPGPPGNRHVREIRPLRRGGGRVDWSQQGDWIAFDQVGDKGVYEIYLMNLASGSESCLTCDRWELRKSHSLSPAWHPSGDYVVFQVQDLPRRMRLDARALTTPDRGLHGDLWAITREGRDAWQLTRIAENGGAVVDPHFSHEAGQLVWSERLESRRGRWGAWAPRVADFRIQRGLPRLGKVATYKPQLPAGFVVAHGFTADDRGLLISAPDSGRDILRYDLASGALERLTATREYRDDCAALATRGDRIVWVSDRGIERPDDPRLPYRGDLWFLSEREELIERLTFFNDPRSDHALGEALIDDVAWSPAGDRLAVHVVRAVETPPGGDAAGDGGSPAVEEAIYLVDLDESFIR